LSIVAQ